MQTQMFAAFVKNKCLFNDLYGIYIGKRRLFMKKLISLIIVFAIMSMSLLTVSAETENILNMTFETPARYENGWCNDEGTKCTFCYDNNNTEIRVYEFINPDINGSVYTWDDLEWCEWIDAFYSGDNGTTHGNIISYYENINGYDYVKIYYGVLYEGTKWYNTLYIGGPDAKYAFLYQSTDSDKPHQQEFLNMIDSARYNNGGSNINNGNIGYSGNSSGKINLYVNGRQVFPDSDPVIVNDRTFVPIRFVAEAMGCKVSWNDFIQTARIEGGKTTIDIIVGDYSILKFTEGEMPQEIALDVPSQLINDRTYIPIRAVAEAFGAAVDWDEITQSVFISQ